MLSETKLDFAYKYPFSQEAKEVVASLNVSSVDPRYLQEGLAQLKSALKDGKIMHDKVRGITEVKYKYIMGYVYARMLVSAIDDRSSIFKFANAEANAAMEFLGRDSAELLKIANELGMKVKKEDGDFAIGFEQFVSLPKKDSTLRLINQRLSQGTVHISELQLRNLVGSAIEKEISSRLPIDRRNLPKEVVDAAKELKPQEHKVALGSKAGAYAWIEKLLANPIADVRHRSVNLIFAPYLVNVKGLDEDAATKTIVDYIERCKQINPNTKINERYIRYQCAYAKRKGMRPLSLTRARELLREVAEFE
jgi:hypothetical protein